MLGSDLSDRVIVTITEERGDILNEEVVDVVAIVIDLAYVRERLLLLLLTMLGSIN